MAISRGSEVRFPENSGCFRAGSLWHARTIVNHRPVWLWNPLASTRESRGREGPCRSGRREGGGGFALDRRRKTDLGWKNLGNPSLLGDARPENGPYCDRSTAMCRQEPGSAYRCHFCRKRLVPLKIEWEDWLGLLYMTVPWQCPHCFSVFQRPFLWIRGLPGVPWVVKRLRSARANNVPHGMGRERPLAPKSDRSPGKLSQIWSSAVSSVAKWLPGHAEKLMPRKERHSAYQCPFCRERLVQQPMVPSDWLGAVFLMRRFQCPHCFSFFQRPFAWLGYLPGVAWLASKMSSRNGEERGAWKSRERDRPGAMTRMFASTGKRVGRWERGLNTATKRVFKVIWAPFGWLTTLLFGNSGQQLEGGLWKAPSSRTRRRRRSRGKNGRSGK